MHIYSELTKLNKSSLALGFFDGLHLGHNVVLKNTIHIAKKYNTQSVVVLFKEHPLSCLRGECIPQILTFEEKLEMLEKIGIDNVVVLNFSEYSNIKAKDYLENILVNYFSPIAITTGFNHNFGFNKEGTTKFLRENSQKYNYTYYEVPPFVINDNVVSCSLIRSRLLVGDFYFANQLLGYNFFIRGVVKKGDKIASKMGFPSANIDYDEQKIRVPLGVYFVKVQVDNQEYSGILNYGYAPTISKDSELKTEVHILDFNKNIYGENIKISFIKKIREQLKFDNVEKLEAQIIRDKAFAQMYQLFINSKTCK